MVSHLLSLLISSALFASIETYATTPEPTVGFGDTYTAATLPRVAGVQAEERVVLPATTTIVFTGDIMLARNVETMMRTYGHEYPFALVSEYIDQADFAVGNFEASMPTVHTQTESMTFNFSVHAQYLDRLAAAGFTHVSQANNHGYDYGLAGYENAVSEISKHKINPFGHPRRIGTATTAYVTSSTGDSVALIGLEAFSNTYTENELKDLLTKASAKSEIQVVYIHWGNEYELTHSSTQRKLAQQLIDAGADLIVGHHPHVVQDIDVYNDVLIFYSLGNFVFDQYFSQDVQEGLMISLQLEEDSSSIMLLPVTSIGSKSLPRLMPAHEKQIFLRALAGRSAPQLQSMITAGEIVLQ